jgi:excisionase family DNA binding protein
MTDKLLLTVQEAADQLGLGRSKTYELIRAEVIPSVRIGRARRIPRDALVTYVEQLRQAGIAEDRRL